MSTRPIITVSSLDVERIDKLLEALPPGECAQEDLLRGELARAQVLAPEDMPANVVTMNSRVSFRVTPGDQPREMTLVYPRDVDGSADKVSVLAPVGAALLGLSVGDRIEWPAPGGGVLDVQIIGLPYQPESAGHYYR